MALIVETGAGLPNSDSYESLTEFKAYADAHGFDYAAPIAYTDPQIEAAMRRATAWLDATYRTRYTGDVRFPATQALEWPRTDATSASGRRPPSASVHPSRASACAMPRPMPRVPPVMNALFMRLPGPQDAAYFPRRMSGTARPRRAA